VQILFRDHAMSDQIGFVYHRMAADQAVDDFLGKVEAIGRATAAHDGGRPPLLPIILDGENCWEYYPEAGVKFLRTLYRRVARQPHVAPVCVSDYLDRHPATDKLGHLFAGSWISHNFAIWIGNAECNRAWDLLAQTRADLVRIDQQRRPVPPPPAKPAVTGQASKAKRTSQSKSPQPTEPAPPPPADDSSLPPELAAAWEELYIAEGSDWFWWYSDDHSSAQDALFDRLFRKHLQNVYTRLGQSVPTALLHPISQGHQARRLYSDPTGFLDVKIDGRQTYFEWLGAGHYASQSARGTMTMTQSVRATDLYFGFDVERLLLRIDGRGGSVAAALADVDAVRVVFLQPEGFELVLRRPAASHPMAELVRNRKPAGEYAASAASDAILEAAVSWQSLSVTLDEPIHFYVELVIGDNPVERLPAEGAIETFVPSPDFELIMWQA
jgi:alpha-amylase/alpha-mannosidase (GH57 family)